MDSQEHVCLKEADFKEIHGYISSSNEYRKSLDAKVNDIKSEITLMKAENSSNFRWLCGIFLVPIISGLIWVGGMNSDLARAKEDIDQLKTVKSSYSIERDKYYD